jgi:tRNA pseudouridine38-40 synthase
VRSKTYRYRILQSPVASPFVNRFVWHYPFPLDVVRMAQAARLFEGEHDFSSFAAAEGTVGGERSATTSVSRGSAETTLTRTIFTSRILRRTRTCVLIYEVTGSGFLHHMVRNIVGTLVEVGRGKLEPADITRILQAHDRTLAGPTAPAQGLCLVRVEY